MDCTSCGRSNRPAARFCGGCGASLAPRCSSCGSVCEAGARFCDACGAPLAARAESSGEARKVVTIVFADLIGSTALHERLDAESARAFMQRYYAAMRGAVEAERGQVTQLLGDGVKAVFGAPRVAEDDAIRAVRAAVGMQGAFRALADAQRGAVGAVGLRVAVNSGEVISQGESEIIGDPVNVAAHLQAQAHDGDVLLGESTQRLVAQQLTLAPFGTFALKGRAEPVTAWRVVSLERPAGAPATAFVGREDELRRVRAVYDAAVAGPGARLAVILGSPGLGKSRLLAELTRRLGDGATVLAARCDATGGATFAPLAESLREHLGADAMADRASVRAAVESRVPRDTAERSRIGEGVAALLAGAPGAPEETFFVVRRLLAALAAERPVLLLLDDLHWAEPLLLDFVEHLVQWSPDVPLCVLAAARPELRDRRSSLAAPGGAVADVVTLAGLDAGAATRLAANAIGADELPAAIAGRVLAASEGNPLFVGELARMLVQDGALVREGDRWVTRASPAELQMPPTIQALLAARIERLRPEERVVLEHAAVVGRHFSRAAVAELLPPELRGELDSRLEALRRSELIEPDTGWLLGEPVLRFHHVLIRDAAYRRLLKGTRAELHARFADWLEARIGGASEHDEMLGWHLEQAHALLGELGPLDARGQALGERAARHLAAAGRRALARDDLSLAASLLGRALERLDPDAPTRAEVVLDWGEALLAMGDVGRAERAIDELGRLAGDSRRLRAWHASFAAHLAALADPQSLRDTADAVAAAAQALAAEGDAAGEAKAHAVHALVLTRLGRIGAGESALDQALAAARRGGDRRRSNAVLAGAPLSALWGPSPVTRASGRCLDVVRVLRITQGAPAVEAVALRCQAVLEALRGRADAARRMIAASRRLVEELGITQRLLEADLFAGQIELLEGDAVAAERCLRRAFDGLREHGLDIDAAQAAALLGRALLAQGRDAEAESLSRESEVLAGDDRIAGIAWRCVRAEALARRGEPAAAVEVARAAVEMASATDALLDHADARIALASALRAAGRADEARAEEARAISLWEAKGATLRVERARGAASREVVPTPLRDAAAPLRRVRENAASAAGRRVQRAVEARDTAALPALFGGVAEVVEHATGTSYDGNALILTWTRLLQARNAALDQECLATLGDALALFRGSMSFSGLREGEVDFGAVQRDELVLIEVDAHGEQRRIELFALDRLADAVVRLYARYAELQPEGPGRDRALATARVVAAMRTVERGSIDASFDPDAEYVDHRRLGFPSLRGARAIREWVGTLFDSADDVVFRLDEILDLRPDALLVRYTNSGTERAGGGRFERCFLSLEAFGADGLLRHWEHFHTENESQALGRLDALTAPRGAARRVRPNAATASAARMDATVAARDLDAFLAELSEDADAVDHSTGAAYPERDARVGYELMMASRGLEFGHEPLATLGEALALCRRRLSMVASAEHVAPFGASDFAGLLIAEVDGRGLRCHTEFFAEDHLGDALARLYERYAERMLDGGERARAAARARSVAALARPITLETASSDLESIGEVLAPDVEFVDHRRLGLGTARGAEVILRWLSSMREVVDDFSTRIHDVGAVRPDALLFARSTRGRDSRTGGEFEVQLLQVIALGADGRVSRIEWFDLEREADALARFDAFMAPRGAPHRRVRPNAATSFVKRLDASAKDAVALRGLFADDMQVTHHPTNTQMGRDGALARFESLMRAAGLRYFHEPLATLGELLVLCRVVTAGTALAAEDVPAGAFETDVRSVIEVDAGGRERAVEVFAADHLGDALARLYERYAELLPEGPERTRVAATARTIATVLSTPDPARYAEVIAPDIELRDWRRAGLGTLRGAEAYLEGLRALLEVAKPQHRSIDDVLALRSDALLVRVRNSGTLRASGGAYETIFLMLLTFGADGHETRNEQFDADGVAEALARFDELAASPAPRFENAASRAQAGFERAWRERNWEAVVAHFAPGFELQDRRALVGVPLAGENFLANLRFLAQSASSRFETELIATRGERLALFRARFRGELRGGPFEDEHLSLVERDAQGRSLVLVSFDAGDLEAAHAELDARFAAGEGAAYPDVLAALDALRRSGPDTSRQELARFYAADFQMVSHRRFVQRALTREQYTDEFCALAELGIRPSLRIDHLRIARGALILDGLWSGRRDDGDFELPHVIVNSHDGRLFHSCDLYDDDQLESAQARFAELSARPRWRENLATRSEQRAVEVTAAGDWEASAALFPPHFRSSDRRKLMHLDLDRDQFFSAFRASFEIISRRESEILATRGERLALIRVRLEGRDGAGGPSEMELIQVLEVDEQGERIAAVGFDPEDVDAAYAELERRHLVLSGASHAARPVENAATRTVERLGRVLEALDFARIRAFFAPEFRHLDRGRNAQVESGLDDYLAALRPMIDELSSSRLVVEHLATRGERLSLSRSRWLVSGDSVGPSEIEWLDLIEVDDQQRVALQVSFDPEDLDAAYAELDARFADAAGERRASLTRAFTQAFRERDWDALTALLAPELVVADHRRLGWETLRGPEAYVGALRSLVELAPDVRLRVEHAEMSEPGYLYFTSWHGTREGGAFEEPSWIVCELDAQGRIRAFDQYELEQQAEARARLAEIGAKSARDALRIPSNAASRAAVRWNECIRSGDFEALRALLSPDLEWEDHRRLTRARGGREDAIASARLVHEAGGVPVRTPLAIYGDRLALDHVHFTRAGRAPFEVEILQVTEVDERGRVIAGLGFDADDRRSTSLELFERYARGEGARFTPPAAVEFVRAMNDHDLERMRVSLPEDFEFVDHRRTGVGGIGNRDEYVASIAALIELAPDLMTDTLHHVAVAAHGSLTVGRMFGTLADGGAFEMLFVRLTLYRDGRMVRAELFEPDDLDRARARFEALRPRNLLEIPPNAATRVGDRLHAAREAEDWDALMALCSSAFVFDDRRRSALTRGDRDMFVTNNRWLTAHGVRLARRTVLATAGDRLALEHSQWFGSNEEVSAFALECLLVTEIGADGRVEVVLVLDPDDRRAASLELFERYVRGEGAAQLSRAVVDSYRAQNAHDLGALRALLPAEFVFHDHRRTGLGRIEGADAFLASLVPLFEQAPDVTFEALYAIAQTERGELSLARMFGTLAQSGGAVESVYLRLGHWSGERLISMELFEPADLDAARARLEALRPLDLLAIPPNAATRASERWDACVVARDWEGLTDLFTPDFRFDDRRRLLRDSGDREKMVASVKVATLANTRAERTLVATAGERIALEHLHFSVVQGGSPVFEIETLQITEICEDGRIVGLVSFDPDDRRAGFAELRERFFRGEGARWIPPLVFECSRALNARELERARAAMHPEYVHWDHRRAGAGRLEGPDAYLDWVRSLFEVSPDAIFAPLYYLALASHGSLSIVQTSGTDSLGGEFASPFVQLMLFRDGRTFRVELFELDDLERAKARFEEAARS
ncbi:MAG TPA: nuclear transport factor 2 family protein [Myxococcota bacterium]|nr:nuclear transport factor 2 family protein [Myxococcota bacterium]